VSGIYIYLVSFHKDKSVESVPYRLNDSCYKMKGVSELYLRRVKMMCMLPDTQQHGRHVDLALS